MPGVGEVVWWGIGIAVTIVTGIVAYYLKRERQQQDRHNAEILAAVQKTSDDFNTGLEKLRTEFRSNQAVQEKRIERLEQKLNDFIEAAPYKYTLRDDFIRALSGVERKLDKIIDNQSGMSRKGEE